jgi:hypothetical protein
MQRQEAYPVRFTVDYPDRPLDRLTTAFRIFVAIPIMIVLGAVSGGESWQWSNDTTMTGRARNLRLVLRPATLARLA